MGRAGASMEAYQDRLVSARLIARNIRTIILSPWFKEIFETRAPSA